ncbi:MAG: DUF3316 domain-containing protein [Prevotella sp.]|nr:DUF3316 domain-containing protein [Prevotella sp.]
MKNRRLLLALCAAFAITAAAQKAADSLSPRPPENVKALAVGTVNMLDTYLSQEKYTGGELRFINQTYAPSLRMPRWGWQTNTMVSLMFASPRADNSDYLGGMISYAKALRRTFLAPRGWLLEIGPQVEGGAGVTYTTLGGNNPAQAKIYLNAAVSMAAAHDLRVLHRTVTLRSEIGVPLAGMLFSPNYGQSYYEIFSRGNYDHNIVPVTIFSAPSLRAQLSADLHLRRFALRLAYLVDIEQAEANNLKYHTWSHLLAIGVSKSF